MSRQTNPLPRKPPKPEPTKPKVSSKPPAEPERVGVEIPPIEIGVVSVKVVGTQPLIVQKWSEKARRQMAEKQAGKAHRARDPRDPEADYQAARYLDENGRDCVKAIAFKNAMIQEASFLPTVTKVRVKGAIFVRGDLLPLRFDGDAPIHRDDMVRIGGIRKTADIRYRPEYRGWSCDLVIEFDHAAFTAEQVVSLLNRAGFNVGIGEYRPEFGRFKVQRE